MTQEQFDTIYSYFLIIQTMAERTDDEFSDAIKQVCKDAMKYTWDLQKELQKPAIS